MKKLLLIVVAVVLVSTAMLLVLSEMDDSDAPASSVQNQPPNPRSYVVSTLAGTFFGSGLESIDGPGAKASFRRLAGIALAPDGSLYVADTLDYKIRKITADGTVSTIAGKGFYHDGRPDWGGYVDGDCAGAAFHWPSGIAVDQAGNVYVAELYNNVIRKITISATGCKVSTLAGSGKHGDIDGAGRTASFDGLHALAIDAAGNLYVASNGTAIRKVTPDGVVTTITSGSYGDADGATSISVLLRRPTRFATALRNWIFGNAKSLTATFGFSCGFAVDAAGNVYYVSESFSGIRKITPDGWVSTLAGTNKTGDKHGDRGIAADAHGNVYAFDGENRVVRILPTGEVTTIAGAGGPDKEDRVLRETVRADESKLDGPADKAVFFNPTNMVVGANGVIYVADSTMIRKITPQP